MSDTVEKIASDFAELIEGLENGNPLTLYESVIKLEGRVHYPLFNPDIWKLLPQTDKTALSYTATQLKTLKETLRQKIINTPPPVVSWEQPPLVPSAPVAPVESKRTFTPKLDTTTQSRIHRAHSPRRKRKYTKLTRTEDVFIFNLYQQGLMPKDIRQRTNRGSASVSQSLHRHYAYLRVNGEDMTKYRKLDDNIAPQFSPETRREVYQEFKKGMTLQELAQYYGVTVWTISIIVSDEKGKKDAT